MTFFARLESHAALTADYLEQRLVQASSASLQKLSGAMAYAALNGGKRFRPFLVIETAALFGLSPEQALPTAAALECIHCYSLVHDDLPAMDNDDLRRGKPTVHIAYDEATAILAGDGLLTLAFQILSNAKTHQDPVIRCDLIAKLAEASGWQGMVGGQALDLAAENNDTLDLPDIAHIQALKTGALITFACEAGAILGKAKTKEREALILYGQKLGRAFQIADDLLDIEGTPETVGKATAKDEQAGKATFVSLMGISAARKALRELENAAIQALSPFGHRAEILIEAAHFVSNRDY